jgi:hypothetical protein
MAPRPPNGSWCKVTAPMAEEVEMLKAWIAAGAMDDSAKGE